MPDRAFADSTKSMLNGISLVVLMGLSAVLVGWLATRGQPLLVLAPAILMLGIMVAARSELLFWSVVLGGLVVAGLARLYLPSLEQVRWLLAPATALLALQATALYLARRPGAERARGISTLLWWALGFVLASLAATFANGFQLDRFVVGFKGYYQVWALLIALALAPWPPLVMDRLPRVLLVIAIAQIPFVLHQLLVLVPARAGMGNGIVPIDVVAGTFGAVFDGGGANATLSAFLMIVIAGLVAGRQLGVVSKAQLWGIGALLMAPVLVNQAKVSIFYLLAVYLGLFGADLVRRPLRFLTTGLAMLLMLAVLMVAFTLNSPDHEDIASWQDLVAYTYEYNVEAEEVRGRLSRFGAFEHWADMHDSGNWREILLGHGIGYTRVPDARAFPAGTVTTRINGVPVQIDLEADIGNTAVVALLWETGVLGLGLVFALLAVAYRTAGRLEPLHAAHPERLASLRAARIGMVIIFITLWHKNFFVLDVVYQTLVVLLIGYVAYWDGLASRAKGRGGIGQGERARGGTQGRSREGVSHRAGQRP
ncbi:hypothetical protein [Thiorhodococcus minor]|uniref:O-antigen ligase family protein n=1 Tax=Thiorhodococcus minor TaxID=57489 RepID=A0A6M0JZ98_9GAMM|nr:hypothetical protein [Thiorhodococcus minor]NEV62838.1 hypothetical protein [Thiorhodococcus minor]